MTYTILLQIQDDLTVPESLPNEKIQAAARQVLSLCQAPDPAELSIVLATDDYIQGLNKQFRQIDAPTDILSFPFEELPEEIEEDARYLGDIVIGLPYSIRRAEQEGHSAQDEVLLLVVHGALHLMGYDHDTPENQTAMWGVQAEALRLLNVNIEVPDYIHD